ncbi:MAG: cell division protein ZipA [Lysobacterales bacterium]
MDGLRWILLLVGAAIVGGIYFFGTRKEAQASLREAETDDSPVLDNSTEADPGAPLDESMERELAKLGQLISEDRQPVIGEGEPASGPGGMSQADPVSSKSSGEAEVEGVELPNNPEKIITLLLRGAGSARLHGTDIVSAAEKVGLSFGDKGIYHRMVDRGDQQVAVFSMANITNPGTFDMEAMATTFSPGLCLFLTLPNDLSALDSWDAMYAAGQRLADLLECSLLDDSGSSLTRQTVAHIRDQMREYDRGHDHTSLH